MNIILLVIGVGLVVHLLLRLVDDLEAQQKKLNELHKKAIKSLHNAQHSHETEEVHHDK